MTCLLKGTRWSVCSWCDGSSDRSLLVDPLSYLSFQPMLHNWYNKGRGRCYPVCGMVYIKETLLLMKKTIPCSGDSRFYSSLSEWSFTICPTPYKNKCVEYVVKCNISLLLPKIDVRRPRLVYGYILRSTEGRKEVFYLTMHWTHFIYGYMASDIW